MKHIFTGQRAMMSCDQCGVYNGHEYYCPNGDQPRLPVGLKPTKYVAELADWLKQVDKAIKAKKREENAN